MAPIAPFGFAGILVPCNGDSSPNSTGFTLLKPQVSVGNIGHLAVDLVISILCVPKEDHFYTENLCISLFRHLVI
uniref:Proteasome assembly chaperone 2 n=1 Tax=Pavo cristatus TaxID=9049 RepID=A0A8C9EQS8_PAVCR